MIVFIVADAQIEDSRTDHNEVDVARWHVVHPSNGAILAYCDLRVEAEEVCHVLAEVGRAFANCRALANVVVKREIL